MAGSIMSREAAIAAARHHLDRAESALMRTYWQRVVEHLERGEPSPGVAA